MKLLNQLKGRPHQTYSLGRFVQQKCNVLFLVVKKTMSSRDTLASCQYVGTAPSSVVNKLNVQFISPALGDSIF